MERIIPVTKLASSTATRLRGQGAYVNLVEYLKGGESVSLDLRGQELISMSFLDQIVLNLKAADLLDKVTFLLNEPAIHQRIARIAAFRDAVIFYKSSESEPRKPIEPQPSPELQLKPRSSAAGA